MDRARAPAQLLPAGAPSFDFAGVTNADEADEQRRQAEEHGGKPTNGNGRPMWHGCGPSPAS